MGIAGLNLSLAVWAQPPEIIILALPSSSSQTCVTTERGVLSPTTGVLDLSANVKFISVDVQATSCTKSLHVTTCGRTFRATLRGNSPREARYNHL